MLGKILPNTVRMYVTYVCTGTSTTVHVYSLAECSGTKYRSTVRYVLPYTLLLPPATRCNILIMSSDDLSEHITSEYDFYKLLGVSFETSEADIRRAYRRTALKYHPDHNAGNAAAVEKFHLLQIGYELLSDPAAKAAYDNARAARLAKRRQKEQFDGKRRQMVDDLERRERGVKRGRDEELDAEEKLRLEVARLAEDGKRRRKEREELLRRENLEEEEERDQLAQRASARATDADDMDGSASTERNAVSEIDRTVKVRWPRDGPGQSIDKDKLESLFSIFGKIDSTFLLKDRKRGGDNARKKRTTATGVIQYTSIVGAHAAVEDFSRQEGPEWTVFNSVQWASGREPEFKFPNFPSPQSTREWSPSSTSGSQPVRVAGIAPEASSHQQSGGDSVKHVPSFTSFKTRPNTCTTGADEHKATTAVTPSLEEMTLIRLKNAEKKRLEDEIRRREAEEERREEREAQERPDGRRDRVSPT